MTNSKQRLPHFTKEKLDELARLNYKHVKEFSEQYKEEDIEYYNSAILPVLEKYKHLDILDIAKVEEVETVETSKEVVAEPEVAEETEAEKVEVESPKADTQDEKIEEPKSEAKAVAVVEDKGEESKVDLDTALAEELESDK